MEPCSEGTEQTERGRGVDNREIINETLVHLFHEIQKLEEEAIITEDFKDLTNNDMHIIEAVGLEGGNMSSIAARLDITVGSLTTSMNSLVKKGYVEKIQSTTDRREYNLRPTQKYIDYYNISYSYLHTVVERARERFSPEDCAKLEEMLTIVSEELMPELDLPKKNAE